ncbi:MAG: E2/UBC family protein [Pseudohongiellaceae bacterium]
MAALTPDDENYLNGHYSDQWEVPDNGSHLLIRGYHLPDGYDRKEVDMMVLIPAGYPAAALDMFYFSPSINRKDSASIRAVAQEEHFGCSWQRWSRHYQWQPGVHCVATHFQYIENALLDEAK